MLYNVSDQTLCSENNLLPLKATNNSAVTICFNIHIHLFFILYALISDVFYTETNSGTSHLPSRCLTPTG